MSRFLLLCYLISYLYLIFHLTFGFDLLNLRLKHWQHLFKDIDELSHKVNTTLAILRIRFYLALVIYFVTSIYLCTEDILFAKQVFLPSWVISIAFLLIYDRGSEDNA